MKGVRNLNKWANSNLNLSMHALRMILGVFLFIKGVQFSTSVDSLIELIQPKNTTFPALILAHYVIMAHIAGGILVFFGLITRLALLIQLPLFIGAVTINIISGAESFILAQSIFGLVCSTIFIIYGSGRYSADYRMQLEM